MPTAWDILVLESSLPEAPGNTAWDHLNNIVGGGGGDTFLTGCLAFDMDIESVPLELDIGGIELVLDIGEQSMVLDSDQSLETGASIHQLDLEV